MFLRQSFPRVTRKRARAEAPSQATALTYRSVFWLSAAPVLRLARLYAGAEFPLARGWGREDLERNE